MKFQTYFFILIFSNILYAHSGRTDSRGGHHDRINGGYHYHHGRGPHQHKNGICPYDRNRNNDSNWSYLWYIIGVSGLGYLAYNKVKKKPHNKV